VANVSHELRTPLTALLGFIETLRGAARDDAVARERFLGVMEREAARMNRLVSDLLQLSRVEAAERVRPADPVDLAQVLAMTLTAVRPLAEAAGVELVFDAPGSLVVPGDADQLTQVFQNLIENAVKYGGAGKRVTITLSQGDRGAEVAVRDLGEGIAAIHIPRLTERFYRVDSHRSREKGGTGLGLAIVKHIVNRHRGRLVIDSSEGKGSTFTVILPELREFRPAAGRVSAP
jgi:two-component system phosphate regulon sensor histidine kinase PhoR